MRTDTAPVQVTRKSPPLAVTVFLHAVYGDHACTSTYLQNLTQLLSRELRNFTSAKCIHVLNLPLYYFQGFGLACLPCIQSARAVHFFGVATAVSADGAVFRASPPAVVGNIEKIRK